MSLESINRLAELTGRTRRTVTDRVKGLTPVMDGRTKLYESSDVLPLIYDLGEHSNPMEEMARLNKLRGDKIEHDLEIATGVTGPIPMLTIALSKVAELINSNLGALPLRLKKRCPKLTARDIEEIRRVIAKLQNEISKIQLK